MEQEKTKQVKMDKDETKFWIKAGIALILLIIAIINIVDNDKQNQKNKDAGKPYYKYRRH